VAAFPAIKLGLLMTGGVPVGLHNESAFVNVLFFHFVVWFTKLHTERAISLECISGASVRFQSKRVL
jgi:hypothetical protein